MVFYASRSSYWKEKQILVSNIRRYSRYLPRMTDTLFLSSNESQRATDASVRRAQVIS